MLLRFRPHRSPIAERERTFGICLSVLLAVAALTLSACNGVGEPLPPVDLPSTSVSQTDLAPPHANGSRYTSIQGVPALHLRGTRREMGEAHGQFLKAEIDTVFATFIDPYVARTRDRYVYDAATQLLTETISAGDREEIEGLASGSGRPVEDIQLLNCFYDIAHALAGKDGIRQPIACSAVAVSATRTKIRKPIIGRNLDWGVGMEGVEPPPTILVSIHPPEGKPFLLITWPGMVGALTGMNMDGVTVAACAVPSSLGLNIATPFMLVIRDILAGATSTEHAHEILLKHGATTTNSVLLADTRNTLWVMECSPERFSVRKCEPEPSASVKRGDYGIAATNQFFAPNTIALQHVASRETRARNREIASELSNLDPLRTPKDVLRIMQAVSSDTETLQSMVILPAEQTLYLKRIEDESGRYFLIPPANTYGVLEPELIPND